MIHSKSSALQAYVARNASCSACRPANSRRIIQSTSEKDIKRHYRKLSLKYHPDKLRDADNTTLEAANTHYIELTKAYKALTDEEVRNNFEQYGHPDGKQEFSMGIALPKFIVESQNSAYVLGLYGLLFGVALPWFIGSWWYGSRRVTKDGVLATTAGLFFRELKEEATFAEMLQIIAAADEFSAKAPGGNLIRHSKAVDQLEEKVKEAMQDLTTDKLEGDILKHPHARRAAVLLYAHLLRVPISNLGLLKGKSQLWQEPRYISLTRSMESSRRQECRSRESKFALPLYDEYCTIAQLARRLPYSHLSPATYRSSVPPCFISRTPAA